MSIASKLKWVTPALILIVGVIYTHLQMVPETPIEEEVQEILFGGTLANNVAVDTTVETTNTATDITSPSLVWVDDTNGYIFYEDSGGGLSMSSTTNSGATWSAARNVDSVNTADVVSYAVWWEGWTPGTTTTRYIHIATTDLGVDDTYYTRLDLTTGSFSTTVLGTTQAATCTDSSSCYTSITMSATGTLMMTAADASDSWVVRCGQYNGCTTASNWHETFATGAVSPYIFSGSNDFGDDIPILLPVPGTNNIMLVYRNISVQDLEMNMYSGTSSTWWRTVSSDVIVASADDNATYEGALLGGTIASSTGGIYIANSDDANDYTTADHDVDIWSYSTSTWSWTEKTNCTTDTSGVIATKVSWDETNGTLYCIFGRRTTIGTATTGGIYYKTSTDAGGTWSATSTMVNDNADDIHGVATNIVGVYRIGVTWNYTTAPRADQQFYDDIADLIADGGGGSPGVTKTYNVIWLD